jgi:hypothetical protein
LGTEEVNEYETNKKCIRNEFGNFQVYRRGKKQKHLSAFLASQSGVGIDNFNVKLSGTFKNGLSLFGRNCRSDFSGVLSVVHQKELQILHIEDTETIETIGKTILSLFVRAITNFRHINSASEPSSHSVVNTSGLPPAFPDAEEKVRLEASNLLGALLYYLLVSKRLHHFVPDNEELLLDSP